MRLSTHGVTGINGGKGKYPLNTSQKKSFTHSDIVRKSKEEFPNPYNWSGYIVGQILSKPEYMGHTVNFRSHKQSYKDKNPVMNPQEDCPYVFPCVISFSQAIF